MTFALRLAWRETRSSWRRLGLIMASVAVGVAALVAIRSFTDNLQTSVREQARVLLGADLVLSSASTFSAAAEAVADRIQAAAPGARRARVVSFAAMAYVPRTAGARLVQVAGVEPGYPFYGRIETDPPAAWQELPAGGSVVVEPSLLSSLDARVGDALALGEARLLIRGVVTSVPGDVGLRAALGPRVYVSFADLPATGLLRFGSRARHELFFGLPAGAAPQRLADRHRPDLARERVNVRTVAEDQRNLNASLGRLGRYLGLVALVALLLGGLGVASAVHVFIRRRTETIAVLRCLGAPAGQIVASYLLQTAALGLAGSLLGAAAGLGVQALLPRVLRGMLPLDVPLGPSWPAVASGVGLGLWASLLFALLPVLAVRRIPPLAALRRPYEPAAGAGRDALRVAAAALLCLTLVAVALSQAPTPGAGFVFAAALAACVFALWISAVLLTRGVRRFFPARWPYVWRQGLANLYRPANQTVLVVLALGSGAFLLDTLSLVQHNLLGDLRLDEAPSRPNFALFDIQPDQRRGVEERLQRAGRAPRPATPIVPMRLLSVKGRPVAATLGTVPSPSPESGRSPHWALRREYRSTYRDTFSSSERLVAGTRWEPGTWKGRGAGEEPVPISVEVELAREIGVGVGDELVWDVQGLAVPARVASLRAVEWARFEPNFFVVFPVGPLDDAPQTFVSLARVEDAGVRVRLQRDVLERFPNVTAVDLSELQRALETIVGRVSLAIRFMALFSVAAGAMVLLGAVASSRYQRLREGVLLKALGATRRQVLAIALAEYLSLGTLAALVAAGLSILAGWGLARFLFESTFTVPAGTLLALSVAVVALTVAVGLWSSVEVFRRPSLELLRSE